MKRLQQKSWRVRKASGRRTGKASRTGFRAKGQRVGVGASVMSSDVDQLLAMLPVEVRQKAVAEANKACGRVVRNEMRKRAPQSKKTGSAQKLHGKKKERAEARRFNLAKSIALKTKVYGSRVLTMVGARRPDGNHAHLIEFGHVKVLWGHKKGGRVAANPFMRASVDATRRQQKTAVLQTLKKMYLEV